jgi:hypothetical protein
MKWISWLLDNIWAAVIIVGVIAQMFQAITKRKGADGDEGVPRDGEQPKPYEFEDPELAERTRKIREDIERRIKERARGYADEQPTLPHDQQPEEAPPVIYQAEAPPPPPPVGSRFDARRDAEIAEEQAALMEQLAEAEQMKLAAQKRREFEVATSDHSEAARTEARASVVEDLRSPAALRRAFILREVLGPPVALRR